MSDTVLTVGQVADLLGVERWCVQRVIERGMLTSPDRVGPYRVFYHADLPRVEEALLKAGYLGLVESAKAE